MFGLTKTANEYKKEKQHNPDIEEGKVWLGLGGMGAGAKMLHSSTPKITGMERLYHGTSKSNAENIKENGILGDKAGSGPSSQRVDLAGKIGEENVKNKSYATRSLNGAVGYASEHGGGKVLNVRIPYQDLKNGVLKEVANPELRGMDKNEWVNTLLDETKEQMENRLGGQNVLDEIPFLKPALTRVYSSSYKALDAPNTLTVEGNIPPQYIKESPYFQGQTLKGLEEYVKDNPGRFSKGLGLAALGVGTAGLGGAAAYDGFMKRKEMDKKAGSEQEVINNVGGSGHHFAFLNNLFSHAAQMDDLAGLAVINHQKQQQNKLQQNQNQDQKDN